VPFRHELNSGLTSLGHVFAPHLAEQLGRSNWMAADYSQKLWYEEWRSVPIRLMTITAERRLRLHPRMLPHRLAPFFRRLSARASPRLFECRE